MGYKHLPTAMERDEASMEGEELEVPEYFEIWVTTMMGDRVSLLVFPTDTVEEVKVQVFAKLHILPEQQSLMFEGAELVDEKMLMSYPGLQAGSVIKLFPRINTGFDLTNN